MANITPTITRQVGANGDNSVLRIVWTPVTEADVCLPVTFPEFADKTIQVLGTFGGGTLTVTGSCDGGTTYFGLRNSAHSAISLAAAGGEAILENTEWLKPVMTGGTSQSVTIAMTARLGNPLRT